jgi:hypothetical protein
MHRRFAAPGLLNSLFISLAIHSGCAARVPPTTPAPATSPTTGRTPAVALSANAWTDLQRQLVGRFTATREGGTISVSYKVISGGSAMLETWSAGGHETVTLYHRDGDGLMLTHYCAQGNQARLTAVEATPQRTVFRFLDATDVGPKEGVLRELIVAPTPEGFDQITTYRGSDGEDGTDTLHFVRDPVAAP